MLTVDDLLAYRSVTNARISPDGRLVAFEVGDPLAGGQVTVEDSRLWLVNSDGSGVRQLTHGPHRDTGPTWSPDGQTLAFLSDRATRGTARLYLLRLDGGEARPLETPPGAVQRFAWSPDGRCIAFVRTDRIDDGRDASDATTATAPDDTTAPVVVEEEPRYDRVWTITVAGGAAQRATEAAAHVWELAWLPDGAGLVLVVADAPTAAAWYRCRLARLDLDTGALATLHEPPAGRQVARPAPSPDGSQVAFIVCSWSDPGMTGGDLWVVPSGSGTARNLTAELPFSIASAVWLADGRTLLYDAYDDNETSLGLIRRDAEPGQPGWRRLWREACGFAYARPSGLSLAHLDGDHAATRLAVARDDPREPGDVWLATLADDALAWRRLTDMHGDARTRLTADREDVRWTASDGLTIGGLLLRPAEAAGPVPLVVLVHGGPTAMAGARFLTRGLLALVPLLAARGIATFLPNYRGSNGRGVAYAEANHGDLGGADFTDMMAGVDHLVATGVADPARLGLGGWSYGGFMTMWAVTQTDRFAAAVAGAGIAEWTSFHGASLLHAWDRIFFQADPYAPAGIYAARSPIRSIDAARTPTLVLHGDADRDVPADQGRAFYRALKDHGVETRLVLYPGAGHGPHEPRHIQDYLERSLAWFVDRLG